MDDGRIVKGPVEAHQATKEGVVRYVLAGGLILVIAAFIVAYFATV
jgi:hypothetical protein